MTSFIYITIWLLREDRHTFDYAVIYVSQRIYSVQCYGPNDHNEASNLQWLRLYSYQRTREQLHISITHIIPFNPYNFYLMIIING